MKEGENGTPNDMNDGGKSTYMYVPFGQRPPTYHLSRGSLSQSLAVDELITVANGDQIRLSLGMATQDIDFNLAW